VHLMFDRHGAACDAAFLSAAALTRVAVKGDSYLFDAFLCLWCCACGDMDRLVYKGCNMHEGVKHC
jgi:hypothetical protein